MTSVVSINESVSGKASLWGNYDNVFLICGATVIILIIVYNIIFSVLADKSDKRAESSEIDKIVMNITSSLNINDESISERIKDKIKGKKKNKE